MKTLFLILFDLIPFAAAYLIKPELLGMAIAFIMTGYLVYMQSKKRRIRIVTVVNGVYFAIGIGAVYLDLGAEVLRFGQFSIYAVLTISTVLSLFIGDPFTMQYAKESTPESVWKHPVFLLINRRLTELWAVLFSLSSLFSVLESAKMIGDISGSILANVWNVVGIVGMVFLPDWLRNYYLRHSEQKLPDELLWKPDFRQEWPEKSDEYDIIIVGSGIGGLVAGVELAERGAKVLVLEQHYVLGGACTTYTRKGGFRFDAGVESVSGLGKNGPVRNLLKKHGLNEKINWLKNTYELKTMTERIVIPQDYLLWRDQIIRQFPGEEAAIRAMFQEIRAAYEEKCSVFATGSITPVIPVTAEEKIQFVNQNPHYFKWVQTTWQEFLYAFTQNQSIHRQMSMLTGYVGDSEENTSTDIMISLMGYFIDGGYRPQGGSGEFAKLLVDKLKEYGGEIQAYTPVDSICVENRRVTGVVTKKGIFHAPIVISNACPRQTYEKLIGFQHLSESYRNKVQNLKPSMSLFVWTAAITRPFCTQNLIHYHLAAPIEIEQLGITVSGVGIYSASELDKTLAPNGYATITMNIQSSPIASLLSAMSQDEYRALKAQIDQIGRRILNEIDSDAANSILFSEVATPKTFAHYMKTYEGSIYNIKRENDGGFPYIKSPIEGLYFTGAGTVYGPGIEAVVISGGAVAKEIDFPVRSGQNVVRENKSVGSTFR